MWGCNITTSKSRQLPPRQKKLEKLDKPQFEGGRDPCKIPSKLQIRTISTTIVLTAGHCCLEIEAKMRLDTTIFKNVNQAPCP
ncbi:hypothetical protein CUMW_037210 [Citrus unshiu]|nr:hypothetical protein CUMW_037210 [Citrus unshiu]